MNRVTIDITGLGIILYSPAAVRHIIDGEDYFGASFLEPTDVARHVMACNVDGILHRGFWPILVKVSPPECGRLCC